MHDPIKVSLTTLIQGYLNEAPISPGNLNLLQNHQNR